MSESKHTPGPWVAGHFTDPSHPCNCHSILAEHMLGAICTVHESEDDSIEGGCNPLHDEAVANARLIASAPDHALIAAALVSRIARWEPFQDQASGEVCVGGLRYSTRLDEFGVPTLTPIIRAAIAKATGGRDE